MAFLSITKEKANRGKTLQSTINTILSTPESITVMYFQYFDPIYGSVLSVSSFKDNRTEILVKL